ncbi:TolC family protein [Desulfovibrio sp. OttesenSCG-928-F20]|nr:TolC family protein [Desulfovibrio sp. OttesenSCG-928-F20]
MKSRTITLICCFLLFVADLAVAAQTFSLEEAVNMALERNFSVEAAKESRLAAEEGRKASRSAFGPVFGTGYDYDRRQHGVSSAGRLQDKELFTWRLSLTQNVFSGFSTLADYQKAALEEESAAEGVRQARLDLVRTVQENFFIYLKALENVRSAEDALGRLQSQLKSSQAFYDVGVSPRIDVLQAEVDVSTAESALLIAENTVATQRARLNTLLLLPLDADAQYKGELMVIPFTLSLDQCLQQAYQKRPDLIIAQKAVQIAEKDITKAQSGFYPQVNAYGAWGTQGSDALAAGSANARTRYNEWTVGVNAEWPLFEWGKTMHESRQAGHKRSKVRAEAENLHHEVGFLVKERMLAMTEAAKRVKVAVKSVEQASEAYRMADARYRQQVGTMTDVLDAQAKLSLSEASLAGARADYSIALASLYAAIGDENPGLKPR